MKGGTIAPGAFSDNHETLSFTFQDETLQTDAGLDQYQLDKRLPSGDFPGLCKLTYEDLARTLDPPLPPRHDPVTHDEKYGHLHCCTARPTEKQQYVMAMLAERHGVVRPFARKKK